jgi:hypothetical protein
MPHSYDIVSKVEIEVSALAGTRSRRLFYPIGLQIQSAIDRLDGFSPTKKNSSKSRYVSMLFVRSLGTFGKNEFPESLSGSLEFPAFKVLPDWFHSAPNPNKKKHV